MENNNDNYKPQQNIVPFLPNGDFYYAKAQTCMDRGDFPKAAKYLKRAVELSPDDAMIFLQYAIVELELGNTENARSLLLVANDLEANNPEVLLFLAETSAGLGMLEEALYYAELYIEVDQSGEYFDEANEIIDFVTSMLGKLPPTEDAGNKVLSREQERARQLMESGEHEQAIEIFENIIAENPNFWSAYNNLALSYFYQGENEQARALLHEVLLGNYGNIHALCNMAIIAYYEKDEKELDLLEETLVKLHPYNFEHRFKLGATLALIGCYEEAFKWLKSLYVKGYSGDAGFYFWLSHSAFFAGDEKFSRMIWDLLLEIDPTKEGFEPWTHAEFENDTILNDEEYIVGKLQHEYRSERLFGLYLLTKTPFKQDILANPAIISVDDYSPMEKIFLALSLGHDFEDDASLQPMLRAIEVAEILYIQVESIEIEDTFQFQMWFMICEAAFEKGYKFKNPVALAAAVEFMYKSSRMKITKKEVAELYEISTPTLTKYIDELMQFLPIFDS